MLNNLFNKNNCKNITSYINNIDDFKDNIIKSKDHDKYYYLIIDDLKYKIGLIINYIFEKLEINNIHMIIIYKGSLQLIKQYVINDEINVKLFDDILNNINKETII